MRWFVLAVLLVACVGCPVTPGNSSGTCESWCSAVAPRGCGVDPITCLDDCHKTVAVEANKGRRFPLGCMTAAAGVSCEEIWKCR